LVCDGTVITLVTGAALPVIFWRSTGEGREWTLGGVVLTVNGDRDVVQKQLADGELGCPSCGGILGGWGNAVTRPVRQLEGAGCCPTLKIPMEAALAVPVWGR
jgi:hypothetical protein